mgnify:FL=1
MFRFPRILSRQAVVITLAIVVTIPVLAYSAEPMGSASAGNGRQGEVRQGELSLYPPSTTYIQATSEAAVKAVASMQFRNIGPAIMGGRVADLAVVDNNPSVFYVGTASGGVWKTVNRGTSFEPVFDDESTASIGDVTVSQRNPNLVWVGTGEPNNRQSSPYGNGVYRSLDGGANWQHMGLNETRHIGRIQIDHRDNSRVFVGAVGHLWGPNEERGVFRTTDAG